MLQALGALLSAILVVGASGETLRDTTVPLDRSRYLDAGQLRPGMKGIGKTVFAGTEIETFDVEVVSVIPNVDPGREMILVRCDGPKFRRTGVAGGMSGSPIYVTDPLDGRLKLIGAIAYGWTFQTEPVIGVQPIRSMLEVGSAPSSRARRASPRPSAEPGDRFVLAGLVKLDTGSEPADRDPIDGLAQMSIPLVIGGASPPAMEWLGRQLSDTCLVPVSATGSATETDYQDAPFEPGSVLCVAIMRGDLAMTALGTVTEVVDGRVLGFGHALIGEGKSEMPLASGYIHTVMPSAARSFKIGSALAPVGRLVQDEYSGILGEEGRKARMIPLNITVTHDQFKEEFEYQTADSDYFTPLAVGTALGSSMTVRHDVPREYSINYKYRIDFGELGTYVIDNFTSQSGIRQMWADLLSPLSIMLDNPFGRARVDDISCRLDISSVARQAFIEHAQLLRGRLRPGENVQVDVTWLHFRGSKETNRYEMHVPVDLPEGTYQFTICSWQEHLRALRKEKPHLFEARNLKELLKAVQTAADVREDRLYCRLVTKEGGLSIDGRQMAKLPSCRAAILADSKRSDVTPYQEAIVVTRPLGFAVSGMRNFKVTIDKKAPR
jgi:hypothetical protein